MKPSAVNCLVSSMSSASGITAASRLLTCMQGTFAVPQYCASLQFFSYSLERYVDTHHIHLQHRTAVPNCYNTLRSHSTRAEHRQTADVYGILHGLSACPCCGVLEGTWSDVLCASCASIPSGCSSLERGSERQRLGSACARNALSDELRWPWSKTRRVSSLWKVLALAVLNISQSDATG